MFETIAQVASALAEGGISNPKREAEDLICDLLSLSRFQLFDQKIPEEKRDLLQKWLDRRLQGEPLAYISGQVEFFGCSLNINPSVLIPRPETEILVEKAAAVLKQEELRGKILLDLCCGSGCIGIAIKKKFPELEVFLSDLSPEAIALSGRNAEKNLVEVTCLSGDLLAPFQGKKAHLLSVIPPYISEEEYSSLDPGVKDFEPRLALVGGKEGLDFYRRLAKDLPTHLFPKSRLFFEIGYNQGKAVQEAFQGHPWKNQRIENDWAGHNRFFFLENE